MDSRERLRKLEALAQSANPHEASLAASLASQLRKTLPAASAAPAERLFELNYSFETWRWQRDKILAMLSREIDGVSLKVSETRKLLRSKFQVHGIGPKLSLQTVLLYISVARLRL